VDLQTSTFQKQCEGLLNTQSKNTRLADDIRDNLAYYDFLDPASRRLNAPGAGKMVRDREFSEMLRKLDECLDYMESHVCYFNVYCRETLSLMMNSPSKKKLRHIDLDTDYY
jgi:Sec34-like family